MNATILWTFLRGELALDEFQSLVADYVTFKFSARERETSLKAAPPCSVKVRPSDLLPVLNAFLAGSRSAADVSLWASVITTVDVFERPDNEAVWDGLCALSFSPVAQSVTEETVSSLIAEIGS
jgi:hypothetical protein